MAFFQQDISSRKNILPDENSTWTNAAVIIAAHAICRQKDDFENVFSVLGRSLESNKTFDTIN